MMMPRIKVLRINRCSLRDAAGTKLKAGEALRTSLPEGSEHVYTVVHADDQDVLLERPIEVSDHYKLRTHKGY